MGVEEEKKHVKAVWLHRFQKWPINYVSMSTFVIEFEFEVSKVDMLTQLHPPINDLIRISTWSDKIDQPHLSPISMAKRGVGSNGTRVPGVTGTNLKTLLRCEVSSILEWFGFRVWGLGCRIKG